MRRPWRSEQQDRSPTIPRILLEFLGGSIGVTVGILPGGLLATSGLCFDCSDVSEPQLVLGTTLAFAGMAAGSAVGIAGAASLLHGEGLFWPTLAGAASGMLAGILCAIALAATLEAYAIVPMALGPIAGGIIAYEFSHARAVSERRRRETSGTQVLPLVTMSPKGGVIGGLAGSF